MPFLLNLMIHTLIFHIFSAYVTRYEEDIDVF